MPLAEQCQSSGRKCCALTIVRIVLGVIFFMHGAQKVLGWFEGPGLQTFVGMMTQMGTPAVLAYAVAFGELLGGLGLIAGLLSRVAAGGVGIIMIGAIVTVHWKNGFFLNWFLTPGKGHGYEYNLALIAMSLGVVLGGSGCLALDRLFCKNCPIED